MKRQKFKNFNSHCDNSKMNNNNNNNTNINENRTADSGKGINENKIFTILLNRSAIFGVVLLFSVLLPLNQAAPTAKPFVQTEIVASEFTSGESQTELPSTTPLKTIQTNKMDDKMMLSALQSLIKPLEKSLSLNGRKSTIQENNQNVETIKIESVRETMATISSTIEHNDQNNNNNISHLTIGQPMITVLPELLSSTAVPNNVVEREMYADKSKQYIINSPPAIDSNDDENEKLVSSTTTTTFLPERQSSLAINGISDAPLNKISMQETIFTTENTIQTVKKSSVPTESPNGTSKSFSDNIVPSLTEIDELSMKQPANPFVTENPNQKLNIVTKNDYPNGNSENNGNGKDTVTTDVFGENRKYSRMSTLESGELGQQTSDFELNASQKPLIGKDSEPTNGMSMVPTEIIVTTHSSLYGKIAKVFDEDKLLGNKKLKHDSEMSGHNHKKYNHKTNKDKSKQKMNEEGGVNDPNVNIENNLPELMASEDTTLRIPTTFVSNEDLESSTSSWKLSSNGNGETTPHHIDDDFSAAKEIGMKPTINDADTIASSTQATTTDSAYISTNERTDRTLSENAENLQTKSVHNENKPQSTAADLEMKTKEYRIETTTHHEKLLTEDNVHNGDAGKSINQAENGFSQTSTPTPLSTMKYSSEISTTVAATTERHNILDYDKSSEEIFDIARDSSSQKPEITSKSTKITTTTTNIDTQKRPYKPDSDEFFLPADDLEMDGRRISSTSTTTMAQQTQPSVNPESTIVRPKGERLTTTAQTSVETTIETDAKQQTTELNKGSTSGHDSDTIFYISNTEVKVVESSVPTPNSKQENQFFPALYEEDVIIDFPGKNNSGWNTVLGVNGDKYEEDIMLSPMKSNFDPTKLNDENLSISYVGESFIDIKEAINDDVSATGSVLNNNDISSEMSSKENIRSIGDNNGISSNVIIEPALIPDMQQQSFGVPIIAELPPQIRISDLDYKSDAIQLNTSGNSISAQSVQHSGDNLQKAQQLTAELPKTDSEEAFIVANEKFEIEKRNDTQTAMNTTAEPIANNVTAYGMLDEEPEPNWNDTQTLVIAGISTVIPLLGCVVLVLAIRQIFMKVRQLHKDGNGAMNGKGLKGDRSTDPLAINVHTVSTDEIKFGNGEANGINHSTEISTIHCDELTGGAGSQTNHHSNANGSLITMTMKNNHLIVETEERSDIARDVRETKVHYSPSEKDGVFVVEVARGADSNSTPILKSPNPAEHALQGQTTIVEVPEEQVKNIDYESSNVNDNTNARSKSNEKVLVHQPPNGMCNDDAAADDDDGDDVLMIDEDGAVSMSSPKLNGNQNNRNIEAKPSNVNTGLSQSDLSISSSGGSNRAYCYGVQESYTVETKGYQSSSPHRSTPQIDRASTPEPITVISDTEHVNESNANDIPTIAAPDEFNIDPLPIDSFNENIITTFDKNDVKALKIGAQFENGNMEQDEHIEHVQQNGIKTESIVKNEINGKINGNHQNGFNGNDQLIGDESNEYDSLMNLPAPPLCEDIKQFTQMDNGNMDILLPPPPPPPELITTES